MPVRSVTVSASFLALLCLLSPGLSFATATGQDECTSVRMDLPGGSVSRLPVLNQEDAPFCFLFGPAQLIDAWRYGHQMQPMPPAHLTSPFATAYLQWGKYPFLDDDEGGTLRLGFNGLKKTGSCSIAAAGDLQKQLAARRILRETYAQLEALRKLQQSSGWLDAGEADRSADLIAGNCCRKLLQAGFPIASLQTAMFKDILSSIKAHARHSHQTTFMASYFARLCTGKTVSLRDLPDLTVLENVDEKTSTALLHSRLNRRDKGHPQPVAISYCADVLQISGFPGVVKQVVGREPWRFCPVSHLKGTSSDHASVVIGRRWNPRTNTCQFLIRNSWGEKCKAEYAEAGWDCERGQIWIDEDKLAKSTKDVSYIGN